jgi:hypothetical protein
VKYGLHFMSSAQLICVVVSYCCQLACLGTLHSLQNLLSCRQFKHNHRSQHPKTLQSTVFPSPRVSASF